MYFYLSIVNKYFRFGISDYEYSSHTIYEIISISRYKYLTHFFILDI